MNNDGRSDSEIIAESVAHPEEFGLIFERHHPRVFRFVAHRLGPSEAGDVAADVFVAAFRVRHRFDSSHADALPWLYGIAYNVVGDSLRKSGRESRLVLTTDLSSVGSAEVSYQADDRLVADRLALDLDRAVASLNKRDRETFLLFALEDLGYSEIADVLGIPVGTISSRIHRCRRQIREAIPNLKQKTGIYPATSREEDA